MNEITLYIGSKNYSSWSLRPWLSLKATGAAFSEVVIPLYQQDTKTNILIHSPSGKVPVLAHGDILVWESLAICEYLAEIFPKAGLWPADIAARAYARAIAAEMHAGFARLRENMPMDIIRDHPALSRAHLVKDEIAHVADIWRTARTRFGAKDKDGQPFLFGRFSNADAMFAPVVMRFFTYGVVLDDLCNDYMHAIRDWAPMQEWRAAATQETMVKEFDILRQPAC